MPSVYRTASGWRAQVRLKNKPSASAMFRTKAEAVAWAREQETQLHKSTDSNPSLTFRELLAEYSRVARGGGRTKRYVLKQLEEYWGEYRLSEMTTGAISRYATIRRRDGLGPASVLHELTYLGTVLDHGAVLTDSETAARAKIAQRGALKSLRSLGVISDAVERSRRVTEAELVLVEEWAFSRPRSALPLFDVVLVALCTAMRLGEIVGVGGIRWEDVDETQRLVFVRGRKDPKAAPRDELLPLLRGPVTFRGNVVDPLEVLLRQRTARRKQGRVFPFAESTIQNAWWRALKAGEIEDLHFHDLRHEAISRLFEYGYRIEEVARVSGHRSWKHLSRYTHIDPRTLHRDESDA